MKLLKYRVLFLFLPFIYAGCSSGGECPDVIHPVTPQHKAKNTACDYRIYMETSKSLNGYLSAFEDQSFQSTVSGLITSIYLDGAGCSFNLYDINSKLIPVGYNADKEVLGEYVGNLDQNAFAIRTNKAGGDQAHSELVKVFHSVFDSLRNTDIALVITDGIGSPGKAMDPLKYLNDQKSGLYLVTSGISKSKSSLVLQFYSDFEGVYYFQDNTKCKQSFHKRPYYIFCFGPNAALEHLMETVQRKQESGLQHFMFLDATGNYDPAPVINVASDYYDYDPCKPLHISDLRKSEADGKCRIKVNLDLSRLHQEEAYISDIHNYTLTAGYSVERIQAAASPGYTHQLTLVSSAPRSGDLQLSLRRKLPDWVSTCNLNADKGLSPQQLEGKTFGIKSLLDGMFEAYNQSMKDPSNYFTIHISVNE